MLIGSSSLWIVQFILIAKARTDADYFSKAGLAIGMRASPCSQYRRSQAAFARTNFAELF